MTINRERVGGIGFEVWTREVAAKDVVGAELDKDGLGALAAACEVERSVAIDAGGAGRVVFAGVEMANGRSVNDSIPRMGKQLIETSRIGDISLTVLESRDLVGVRGKFRLEMTAEETCGTEEKNFQGFGEWGRSSSCRSTSVGLME